MTLVAWEVNSQAIRLQRLNCHGGPVPVSKFLQLDFLSKYGKNCFLGGLLFFQNNFQKLPFKKSL